MSQIWSEKNQKKPKKQNLFTQFRKLSYTMSPGLKEKSDANQLDIICHCQSKQSMSSRGCCRVADQGVIGQTTLTRNGWSGARKEGSDGILWAVT